jgi:hypothetical protein
MADLTSKSVKELKEMASSAKIPGRSSFTTKASLIEALNRLRVSRRSSSSSKKSTSSKSSSGEKLIFRFEPELFTRYSTPNVLPHMTRLVQWFRGFAIEQAEAEDATLQSITHEGKKITITLKLNSPMPDRDKILLIQMIIDPDEDGNHPITVNETNYLVIGKDIERKVNNAWIAVEDN